MEINTYLSSNTEQSASQDYCRLGFWKSLYIPWGQTTNNNLNNLPFPVENEDNYIDGFIEKIQLWKKANTYNTIQFKGFSKCRICNCHNGSREHLYKGFRFPSGYIHYILEHKINVPIEFQKMIINNDVPHETSKYMIKNDINNNLNNLNNLNTN